MATESAASIKALEDILNALEVCPESLDIHLWDAAVAALAKDKETKSMTNCDHCKKTMPEVAPITIGSYTFNVCPICGLKKRNEAHRLPLETPFTGAEAHAMFLRAVHFSGTLAPDWARNVAAKGKASEGTTTTKDGRLSATLDASKHLNL